MKNTLKRAFVLVFAVLLAAFCFACKKVVYEISLNEADKNLSLAVGDTYTVNPTFTEDTTLVWEVTEGDAVTVANGVVKAENVGTSVITVKIAGHEDAKATINVTVSVDWVDNGYISEENYKAYIKYDLECIKNNVTAGATEAQLTALEAAFEEACQDIDNQASVAATVSAYERGVEAIKNVFPVASGIISYMGLSQAEKTDILGALEAYAVNTGITGLSLFENGGYVMYNPRITLGTENYITGYGFGTLAEGSITADLDYETNAAWKRYYHTYNAADPGTANYLNDQGSEVADFYGYIGASFYTTFMNETKNGYDWTPELAVSEKPIAVDSADDGATAKTWKFEVRTGTNGGLKYNTNSTIATRAAFNNRGVELEDYETAFKLLLTQKNGLYRGSELANTSGSGAIAGAKAFYQGTAEGYDAALWENVGIKTFEEDGKPYFQVTFTSALSQFYAMYYISSSLYMPIPQEFLDLVTVENYLGFNKTGTETPVDNSLSLGAYTLETWDSGQQVVYKKNPNYVYASTKYSVQGVHIVILTAASTDTTAGINEFLAGHIDAAGIPQDYLDQYKNDPRTRQTTGDSNFKLNINACDQETWNYLFGKDGIVCQTEEEDYWVCEPALANSHFVKGLSYAINRLEFASARGSVPSVNYFSSAYMSDNENGMSYNGTDQHKAAVASLLADTDGYGYSLELARDYFRTALAELEAEGAYTPGTKENPTEIVLEIAWMYPTHESLYHNEIKKYLEDAFNDESVSGGKYKLTCEFNVGDDWSYVYYDKMMIGQFDLGFGAISGNTLDPLGFMNVLSSDTSISGSFTLNWGVATNELDTPLVYDGKRWSYDALFSAANGTAIVSEGKNEPVYTFDYTELTKDNDGNFTATAVFNITLPDKTTIEVTDIALCNYAKYYELGSYAEYYTSDIEGYSFTQEYKDGKLTVTVTVSAAAAQFVNNEYLTAGGSTESDYYGYMGFDFYFDYTIEGSDPSTGNYESVEDFIK